MSRAPEPPIPIAGGAADAGERLATRPVTVPAALLDAVREAGGTVLTDTASRAEAARDWWPLAIGWAAAGSVPRRPAAVVRPSDVRQVANLLAACTDDLVPVTPVAGRSGVCGGAVAQYGGIALDLTSLGGDPVVDEVSCVAEVPAGAWGADVEEALRRTGDGYTLGHWPQSMDISTVGGWIACRGAGQYSTRYGKIEDMVTGLEVVLANGRVVRTEGRSPRAATGPNLTQLFTGSEGVLGVITRAWLRVHPVPPATAHRALGFATFEEGADACRRVLRRGATPAVVRLYDRPESARSFDVEGACVLLVADEADPGILDATMAVVDEECTGAERLDDALVARWFAHRNDVSALAPLWRDGLVVDTAEVAAGWRAVPRLAGDVRRALEGVEGTLAATVHLSHAYLDGACLYFTFAGAQPGAATRRPEGGGWADGYYRRAWDRLTEATEAAGAAVSHHHGIGLSRGRFLPGALGAAHQVLVDVKRALDPAGILNPGKLGIPSPFGEAGWG